MEGYPQMTPVEADPTSLVYLARTPRVWRGGKGFQPRWRSSTARSMTPLSMSSTILSPSRTNAIGPPSVSFGCDMADRGSGGAAGEPSVGHQQDIAAEARAFDRARDCEHLPHARAAPVSSNDLTRTYRQRTATNYVARQRSYGRCSARSHLSACTSRRNTQSARAVTRRTGGATSSHLAMTAGTPPLFSDVAGVISPT